MTFLKMLLWGVLVFGSSPVQAQENPAVLAYSGTALNLTSGTADTTRITLVRQRDGSLVLEQRFGEERLFGQVRAQSTRVGLTRDGQRITLSFEGTLDLGDDGSGFPPETQTVYTCCLVLDGSGTGEGSYTVGASGDLLPYPQPGLLHLVQSPRADWAAFFQPELNP